MIETRAPDQMVANLNAIRVPNRAWVDVFGSAICTFEGGFGGRVVLVVTTAEFAAQALERISDLPRFKGRVALAVLDRLHAAPIQHAIRQLEASVAIGLEAINGVATHGPGGHSESGSHASSTGLEYVEASDYGTWRAGWLADKLGGIEAASVVSSLAAAQGLATASCDVQNLERVLIAALA